MSGAQLTMIVFYVLALGIDLARHGQQKTGNHSFWSAVVSIAISFFVLNWGGFWEGAIK